MKSKTLIFTAFLLILAVSVACKKKEQYPIEIPFTEYSLTESCQWTNFICDKIIIINSSKELENYVICAEENYPEIDFSKYTLLIANGHTPNGILEVSNRLLQLSANKYKLDIEIQLDDSEGGRVMDYGAYCK